MAHVDMQNRRIFLFVRIVAEPVNMHLGEVDVFCSEQRCRCLVHNA